MEHVVDTYEIVLIDFISRVTPLEEAQSAYFKLFKQENRWMNDAVFEVLQDAFSAFDSYTANPDLLKKYPNYYLSEAELRAELEMAVQRIRALRNRGLLESESGV